MEKKAKTAPFLTQGAIHSILLRLPWLALIPLGLLLPHLLSGNPAWVERVYSQNIYPAVNAVLRTITGILPFSTAEWMLYILLVLVPALLLYRGIRVLLLKEHWVKFVHLCITYFIIFGVALNAFYLVWGCNYFRPPLSTLLELDVRARPVEELEALCYDLTEAAVELRALVKQDTHDEGGVFYATGGNGAAMRKLPDAYAALGRDIPLFRMRAARAKWVLNSEAMSWAGISGIYIPFTAEPNVNVHQPPLLLISSAAHEMAHGLGIAREDEANFVGHLACLYSPDPDVRYSGVMLALIHSGNQLHSADPEAYAALQETYSAGMRRDLRDHNAYWKRYEGPVEELSNRVNDGYLKHNQQPAGIKSYGEMVDLLLAWREKQLVS